MSTAVQSPTPTQSRAADSHAALLVSSLLGALVVLGGFLIAGYVVPKIWADYVAPSAAQLPGFLNTALRLGVQLAAAGLVIFAGTRLAGNNPPRGLRGGIFLLISTIFTLFFVVRAVSIHTADLPYGPPITAAVAAALVFGAFKLLMSPWAEGKMHQIEEQGWLHTFSFKATQGLKLRRYTLIGIVIVGWSGAWTLLGNKFLGFGDLLINFPPHLQPGIAVLQSKELTIPLLIAVGTAWFAWRLVNVPPFADFLIATEAEMNKVSWSSRKKLVQDTIVVLITTAILTTFLLIVDLFWGWLLSREIIHVLPPKGGEATKQVAGDDVKW